uniref:Uncharacterized protein n=1 Tax=Podoviridae sp. ctZkC8 TaxID=2825259 RepID=A0A8S5UBS9_9CAUD|nr:MAG TPA: hypothetical protein [Podoviridae sp. ctZkC8]
MIKPPTAPIAPPTTDPIGPTTDPTDAPKEAPVVVAFNVLA